LKIVSQTERKKKFIRFVAEKDLYLMLRNMGNTIQKIDKFQKQRIVQTVFVFIFLFFFALVFSSWFYMLAFIAPIFYYRTKYRKVKSKYTIWRFQRKLQFSKFARLLIPYLKQSKGEVSLYSIFNKLLRRFDNQADKNSLYTLMTEMSNKPNDIQPFVDFAMRQSGTDMSVLFMTTVYDFRQSTKDTSVIDELGKIASEELMNGIDEIIRYKLQRFTFFPTKIVMSSFIIVLGFAVSVLVYNLSNSQFFLGG